MQLPRAGQMDTDGGQLLPLAMSIAYVCNCGGGLRCCHAKLAPPSVAGQWFPARSSLLLTAEVGCGQCELNMNFNEPAELPASFFDAAVVCFRSLDEVARGAAVVSWVSSLSFPVTPPFTRCSRCVLFACVRVWPLSCSLDWPGGTGGKPSLVAPHTVFRLLACRGFRFLADPAVHAGIPACHQFSS